MYDVIFPIVGLTIIITQSVIFEGFRNYFSGFGYYAEEFINCPMCVGFWVGLFTGLAYNQDIFFTSFSGSLLSWITFIAANNIVAKTITLQQKIEESNDEI